MLANVKLHARISIPVTPRAIAACSDTLRLGFARGFECGEVLDRIYVQRPGGRFGIGPLIDAYVLALPECDSFRQRRNLVRMSLRTVLAQYPGATILDLGSGSGRCVIEALSANPATHNTRTTCVDLDGPSLRIGRALAKKHNLSNMAFEQADALDISRAAATGHTDEIVVVSGLFDYVSDAVLRDTLARINTTLQPRTLIFTARTMATVPSNGLGALIAPASSRARPVAALEAWARAAGFAQIHSQHTADGAHAVLVARA